MWQTYGTKKTIDWSTTFAVTEDFCIHIESTMLWDGKDLKDNLVPMPWRQKVVICVGMLAISISFSELRISSQYDWEAKIFF